MNNDYEAFCLANPLFYDNAGNALTAEPYALSRREAPHLWLRATRGDWVMLSPEENDLPRQGWKIHVSGCLDNAERIIETVWTYCVRRDIAFKFLSGPKVVLARNAKYAGRGGSGKLVTIYPRDDAELQVVCEDLDAALAGEPGPYILSDLRWADGPVHVRYGGFASRHCTDDRGEQVLAIEDATGTLVPDVRGPVFSIPSWATTPECLAPHLEARDATTLGDLPYAIDRALHFSNGGGVYSGIDKRSGDRVVLKEARPHAGLSGEGADAVTRLRAERDALRRLDGIDAVPRMFDYLAVGEHEFLVMEHVEGEALNAVLSRRCPLLGAEAGPQALADYAEWAQAVHHDIAGAVARIHERGIVYGDLHMFNVIVRTDGRICLIDFEVADDADAERRPGLGAVGYIAPREQTGPEIDLYALACLQLALFLPLERLMGLDRTKAAHLAEIIAATFPVPRTWLDKAVEVISGAAASAATEAPSTAAIVPAHWRLEPDEPGWHRAREAIGRAVLASATPDRHDRLFPGDIVQFHTGGLNLAHGAAGVLYALDVVGVGRFPDHEDWLLERLHEPNPDARLGFYDGLHGIAHVLAQFGHTEEAVKVLDVCLDRKWELAGADLHSGLAGMGLNLLHMADLTGDPALHEAARRAAQLVADRLGAVDDVAELSGNGLPFAGLLRGSSGPALLFVRMYERTGDAALLDLAATALRQDLRRCVALESDGQMHVNEGSRTLPYLALGSAGIGLVLSRFLVHRHDDRFAEAVTAIRAAACALFYVQSGLFSGRAGMVVTLADGRLDGAGSSPGAEGAASSESDLSPELATQIRRLGWHALSYEGHLAFPGDQLLRLSMDLATGGAGVLLALGAALHDRPVHLPFLGPAAPVRAGAPGDTTDQRNGRR